MFDDTCVYIFFKYFPFNHVKFFLCSTFSHQNINKTNGKANTCSTGTCFIQKIYALTCFIQKIYAPSSSKHRHLFHSKNICPRKRRGHIFFEWNKWGHIFFEWNKCLCLEEEGAYIFLMKQVPVTCRQIWQKYKGRHLCACNTLIILIYKFERCINEGTA